MIAKKILVHIGRGAGARAVSYVQQILQMPPCPTCRARAGVACKRPSGHRAEIHHERSRLISAELEARGFPEGEYRIVRGAAELTIRYPTKSEWAAMSETERAAWYLGAGRQRERSGDPNLTHQPSVSVAPQPRKEQDPTMAPRQKPKVGRPASPYPERYQVRHSTAQMRAWTAAAKRDARELQSWIRHTLDKAAEASA